MKDTVMENNVVEYVVTVKMALCAIWARLIGKQYVLEFEVEE